MAAEGKIFYGLGWYSAPVASLYSNVNFGTIDSFLDFCQPDTGFINDNAFLVWDSDAARDLGYPAFDDVTFVETYFFGEITIFTAHFPSDLCRLGWAPAMLPRGSVAAKGTTILRSPNELFSLRFEETGNLAVLAGDECFFTSNTTCNECYFEFTRMGGIQIVDRFDGIVKASETGLRGGEILTLTDDGNLILVNAVGEYRWGMFGDHSFLEGATRNPEFSGCAIP
jgi:hypothetical protein